MSIEHVNVGNHVVTYDNDTNTLLSYDPTEDYQKKKERATAILLGKKDEFKQRGANLVSEQFVNDWNEFVNEAFKDLNYVWYNGASIEASLQCMERLSKNLLVEEAYLPIDVQNKENPCIHLGMLLSGWQNNFVTSIVGTFHERGKEFCDYRNDFVKNNTSSKEAKK